MALLQKGNFGPPILDTLVKDRLGFLTLVLTHNKRAYEVTGGAPAPPAQQYFGVPHTRTDISVKDGVATISFLYEGLTDETRDTNRWIYEFEPSFDEVPIQSHPNFESLRKTYGGYYTANGSLRWRPVVDSNPQGSGLNATDGQNSQNPMEGVESFLRMGGVWRILYPKRQLPAGLFNGVGTVVSSVPEQQRLPALPPGRNWMKAPPRFRWRGNAYEVTEEYLLSGLGGHNKIVYDGRTEGGK
jgi:hypothetical protein